jgi:competence protein ComEC
MSEDSRGEPRRIPRVVARAVALPWSWAGPFEWMLAGGWGWLTGTLAQEVEQRRLFPWIAVCFGLGILLFFQADKPSLWAPLGALGLCSLAGALLRRNLPAFCAMAALAALFAGFSAGIIRTHGVAAPVLTRITIAPVTGFIEAVDDRQEGKRLLLRVVDIKGLEHRTESRTR